jgi:hypothetical protein
MQLETLFNSFLDKKLTEEEIKFMELLNYCLTIKSPMKFSDKISDEEILNLIEYMKEQESCLSQVANLVYEIKQASPKKVNLNVFI